MFTGTISIWYFKEIQAGDQDMDSRHVSRDGTSMHSGLQLSVWWRWTSSLYLIELKTQRQLPEVLTLPPSFFLFLDSWSCLPFFTANFSFILVICLYECISLIHNKSGCWILDEYLQCAKEHFICSISFNLPNRPMTLFHSNKYSSKSLPTLYHNIPYS